MNNTYTRKCNSDCKIKDCCMTDFLIDIFGAESYRFHMELKDEHICDLCPFMPLVNKLAEFEGNC